VTVTASAPTLPVPLVRTATVRVNPLGILLTITPLSPVGGSTATGKITLSAPAAGTGVLITLSSSNTNVATVASQTRVNTGQTETTFPITTKGVSVNTLCTITATTPAGITAKRTMNVLAIGLSLSLNPTTVVGGIANSVGTVTLGKPSPLNQTITLTSSNTNAATVQASVGMPSGQTTKSFPITSHSVAADASVTITAKLASGTTATAVLKVLAPRFVDFTVNPASVIGGDPSTGIIKMNAVAPAGGINIGLASAKPVVAQVPATLHIATGNSAGSFTVSSSPVSVDQNVTLTATFAGQTKTATLQVLAPTLTGLTLTPSTVVGGDGFTGKVTIDKMAPAGGITVQLVKDQASTGSPYVNLPQTCTIPAGAYYGIFNATTLPVSRSVSTLISAVSSQHNQQVSAVLTILPR